MKRQATIIISLLFVLLFAASCQSVQIGDQRQEVRQIVGGDIAGANEESSTASEQPHQNYPANPNDTNPDNSNINMWIFLLLLPIFLIGVWLIFIIAKVYRNRS